MKNRSFILISVFAGFGVLWMIQGIASQYLENPETIPSWVESVYPGLAIKFQKMGKETFADFLSQLKWRWLAMAALGAYMFSAQQGPYQPDTKRAGMLIGLLTLIPLLYLPDFYNELSLRSEWRLFYQPIHFWGLILPSLPARWMVILLISINVVCSTLILWALFKGQLNLNWLKALPIPISWMVLLAAFFGFSKIDHTYATMYLGTCLLPILIYSYGQPERFAFVVRILQACIWGSYFFAALEKVFLSGANWINPIHFQQLAYLHPTEINQWIISYPGLGSMILVGGILFQLLTILQWRFAFWGNINLVGAVLFHLGNWLIFNIGGWQTPWLPMVLFLWPGWLRPFRK